MAPLRRHVVYERTDYYGGRRIERRGAVSISVANLARVDATGFIGIEETRVSLMGGERVVRNFLISLGLFGASLAHAQSPQRLTSEDLRITLSAVKSPVTRW